LANIVAETNKPHLVRITEKGSPEFANPVSNPNSSNLDAFISNQDIRPAEQSKVMSAERARMATTSFVGRFGGTKDGPYCTSNL